METQTNVIAVGAVGKLENNIAIPYQFTVGSVLSESWRRVKGAKKTYWGAFLLCFLIYIALSGIGLSATYLYAGTLNPALPIVKIPSSITKLIATLITLPLPFGISYLGLRRSVNLPIRAKQMFDAYRFYWKILGAVIILYLVLLLVTFVIAITVGFLMALLSNTAQAWLLFFPILLAVLGALFAVYILFSLSNAPLLIIEKRFGVFQSIKTSFLAFKQHGFKILGTIICMLIIYFVSIIPLGIGLIWTLPMIYNCMGILYRIQFGIEESK